LASASAAAAMTAATPIEEACSILVAGMAAAVEAVARWFEQLRSGMDMDM